MGARLLPSGAGGRGSIYLGGRGIALERQGVLGILLAFSPGMRVSALLPQIGEQRGGGDGGRGRGVTELHGEIH